MQRWRLRVFESAIIRKIAYLLVGFLAVLAFGKFAHATVCFDWVNQETGTHYSSDSAACASYAGPNTYTSEGAVGTAPSQTAYCDATNSFGTVFPQAKSVHTVTITCAGGCAAHEGLHSMAMLGADHQTPLAAGEVSCASVGSDLCQVTMDSPKGTFTPEGLALTDPYHSVMTPSGPIIFQSAMNNGQSCTQAAMTGGDAVSRGAPATGCAAASGNIVCDTQSAGGKNCGTFNGDAVCVQDLAPGKCVTYASGGIACEASAATPEAEQTPPMPDNGTPGTPAVPDMTVTDSLVGSNPSGSVKSYYFGAAKAAASTVGTPVIGGGGKGGLGKGGPGTCTSGDLCADNGSGGTTCETAPTCTGDTVLCTSLFQEWKARCPDDPTTDLEARLGPKDTLTSGGSYDAAMGLGGVLTSSGPFGSGSSGDCPQPPSITVMGHDVPLRLYDRLCELAALMHPFVVAVGGFLATLIFVRGLLAKPVGS